MCDFSRSTSTTIQLSPEIIPTAEQHHIPPSTDLTRRDPQRPNVSSRDHLTLNHSSKNGIEPRSQSSQHSLANPATDSTAAVVDLKLPQKAVKRPSRPTSSNSTPLIQRIGSGMTAAGAAPGTWSNVNVTGGISLPPPTSSSVPRSGNLKSTSSSTGGAATNAGLCLPNKLPITVREGKGKQSNKGRRLAERLSKPSEPTLLLVTSQTTTIEAPPAVTISPTVPLIDRLSSPDNTPRLATVTSSNDTSQSIASPTQKRPPPSDPASADQYPRPSTSRRRGPYTGEYPPHLKTPEHEALRKKAKAAAKARIVTPQEEEPVQPEEVETQPSLVKLEEPNHPSESSIQHNILEEMVVDRKPDQAELERANARHQEQSPSAIAAMSEASVKQQPEEPVAAPLACAASSTRQSYSAMDIDQGEEDMDIDEEPVASDIRKGKQRAYFEPSFVEPMSNTGCSELGWKSSTSRQNTTGSIAIERPSLTSQASTSVHHGSPSTQVLGVTPLADSYGPNDVRPTTANVSERLLSMFQSRDLKRRASVDSTSTSIDIWRSSQSPDLPADHILLRPTGENPHALTAGADQSFGENNYTTISAGASFSQSIIANAAVVSNDADQTSTTLPPTESSRWDGRTQEKGTSLGADNSGRPTNVRQRTIRKAQEQGDLPHYGYNRSDGHSDSIAPKIHGGRCNDDRSLHDAFSQSLSRTQDLPARRRDRPAEGHASSPPSLRHADLRFTDPQYARTQASHRSDGRGRSCSPSRRRDRAESPDEHHRLLSDRSVNEPSDSTDRDLRSIDYDNPAGSLSRNPKSPAISEGEGLPFRSRSRSRQVLSGSSFSAYASSGSVTASVATTDPMDLDDADRMLLSPAAEPYDVSYEESAKPSTSENAWLKDNDEAGDPTFVTTPSDSTKGNRAERGGEQSCSANLETSWNTLGSGPPNTASESWTGPSGDGVDDDEGSNDSGTPHGEQGRRQRYRVIEQGEVAHLVHPFRQFTEGTTFALPAVEELENTYLENGPTDAYLDMASETPCYFSSELHMFYSNPPAQRKLLVQDLNKAILVRAEHRAGPRAV